MASEECKPREYQRFIFEAAKTQNTLVVLPTGTGKTLIALLLIKYYYELDYLKGQKRVSVFMAPQVPLATQQANYLSQNCDFAVRLYHGDLKVDNWPIQKWSNEIKTCGCMVMTPAIFEMILRRGILTMKEINLIVFDECHNARKNNTYNQIMALHYVPTVNAEKPRVFGMTASPISNRNASSNIQLSINQLETNLCSKAITTDSHSDLQHYVISPTKTIVTYTPNPLSASSNILKKLEEQGIADIPQLRKLHSDARGVQEDFGAWVCDVYLRDAIFSLDKSLAVIRERRDHHLRKLAERESEAIDSTFKDSSDDSIYVDDVACGADFLGDNPKREFYTVDAETMAKSHLFHEFTKSAAKIVFEQLCASDENEEMEDGEISDTTPSTNQDIKGFEFNCSSPLSKNLLDTISGKFMSLVRVLQPYSVSAESFCGIVFVDKRLTARLLNALIPRCEGLEFVRSECLTGHSGAAGGSTRKNVFSAAAANSIVTNRPTEINTQKRILADFQPGKINLLIATKVAEEGIDIQPCNLVVRFDNVKTVISNIQSRGRARHKNSSYVLLVQEDDTRTIESLKTLEGDEVQMKEFLVNREEAASDVEPDSVLEHAINFTKDDIFEIPSGAKMSSLAAVSAIHQYCSLLPHDSFADSMPVFHTGPALVPNSAGLCEMGWVSALQLPVNAPASCHFLSGKPHRTKMGAKRSAAIEGVKRLYTDGSFDDFLRPVRFDVKLQSKAPSEDVNITSITGVESQVDAYCVAPYNVYIPQAFLQVETATNKIDQRYLVLFQLSENSRVLDMAVVLPFKLPNQIVDDTHILLIDKQPQSVRFIPCSTAIQVNGAREELIQRFTNAIFFNGLLRRTPPTSCGKNDYLLSVVPLVDGESALLNLGDSAKADELVDWDMLAAVSLTKFGELKQTQNDNQELKQHEPSAEALVDFAVLFQELDQELIVEDCAFYGRKFQVHAVLHHVSPYSVQFEGFSSLAAYYQQRLNVQDTILKNQPVLLASLIPHMHQSGRSETTSRQEILYLIPQFCTPYPIPFTLFAETACFMPILIQTLYHRLCALEIQQSLKLMDYSTPALFQTALTSAGAQCHQDYERLEFLGDSFLKMYLSLHLFTLNPTRDEGWLSRSRVLLERNKNLLKMSIYNKLPNVLLCEPISRKTWLLPTGTPQTQHVSDKSAADLVESIVGACVVSTGVVGGGKAVRVFFGDEFEESLTAYSFRIESIRLKANMLGSSMINQNSNQNHQLLRDQLFKKLGYCFNDNNLAVEALAHVSAIHIYGIPYCFQRLEFLGDSVLGYLIAKMLFCLPELHKPGKLSSLKSELVNNQFLAIVTFKLGLHKLLLHATPGLAHSLAEFGNQISLFKQCKGTDTQKPLFWHSLPSAPKVAGDILESIIGAVFLDSGCDVQVTEHLIQRVLVQPWKSHFMQAGYSLVS